MNLLKNAVFQTVYLDTTATSLSTGSTSTVIVDTLGYDGVCYVALLGSSDATAKDVGLRLYHGDSSGTFYLCTTEAAVIVNSTAATNGSLAVLDVANPTKRWHSIYAYRLTEGSRINVIAIKYNAGEAPTSQSTEQYGAVGSLFVQSPTS